MRSFSIFCRGNLSISLSNSDFQFQMAPNVSQNVIHGKLAIHNVTKTEKSEVVSSSVLNEGTGRELARL